MKGVWERAVEVMTCEELYNFMPSQSPTDTIVALGMLMEKYREGQKELNSIFVDLEKAYDRLLREELWFCTRECGVAEEYVRLLQDMYESSMTVVRCSVRVTDDNKVEELNKALALSSFWFALVMDRLTDGVRQESPWTVMFADDILICLERREQVEENLERWRYVLERIQMKVSRRKTEHMRMNEKKASGRVRLQGQLLRATRMVVKR